MRYERIVFCVGSLIVSIIIINVLIFARIKIEKI